MSRKRQDDAWDTPVEQPPKLDSRGRPIGRPKKGEPARIDYNELDRLLVFGEAVPTDDGKGTTLVYPSHRILAQRFGVSHSLISEYAKKHNCMRRRKVADMRVQAKADEKLIEMRAEAIAVSKDDAVRIIDGYLLGFEKAIGEGRVRFDNPSDFNTMVRLKEFVLGGADSRQELHAALSLEDIQARHRRMVQAGDAADAAVRGEVPRRLADPPPAPATLGPGEPGAQLRSSAPEGAPVPAAGSRAAAPWPIREDDA